MRAGCHSFIVLLLLGISDVADTLQGIPPLPKLNARMSSKPRKPFKSKPGTIPTCDDLEYRIAHGWAKTFPRSSKFLGRIDSALSACRQGSTGAQNISLGAHSKEAVLHGKPIQFLHTSKTAGTFFCDCAGTRGSNSRYKHNDSTNCHFLEEDSPAWGDHDVPPWSVGSRHHGDVHGTSCKELAQVYEEKGIDVEGNENYLPSYPLCQEFVNVLFLRDPIERLVSHLVYVLEYFHKFPDMAALYYSGTPHGVDVKNPTHLAMSALMNETIESLTDKWPLIVNEYQTRLLTGYDNFFLPYGFFTTMNRSGTRESLPLLEVAKARLHEFDHIFIVEDNLDDQLQRMLGWDCSTGVQGRESSVPGGTAKLVEKIREKWGREAWEELLNINQMDNELITEAKFLKLISDDYGREPAGAELDFDSSS